MGVDRQLRPNALLTAASHHFTDGCWYPANAGQAR